MEIHILVWISVLKIPPCVSFFSFLLALCHVAPLIWWYHYLLSNCCQKSVNHSFSCPPKLVIHYTVSVFKQLIWERECTCDHRGRGRGRGRDRVPSRLRTDHSLTRGSVPQPKISIWAETKSRCLSRLHHPGAPLHCQFKYLCYVYSIGLGVYHLMLRLK